MLQQNKILLWFTEKVHNDKQPIHCYSQNIAVRHQIIFLLPLEANWDSGTIQVTGKKHTTATFYKINGKLDLSNSFKMAKNKEVWEETRYHHNTKQTWRCFNSFVITNLTKLVHIMINKRLSFTTELEAQHKLWFLIGF